jgi:uncharacterized protein YxjI
MHYLMRQKILSWGEGYLTWGEEYRIKDDTGQDVFFVKGKLFRAKRKFSFQDIQENELAVIQQKIISPSLIYEIYRDSEVYATMSKSFFTLIGHAFTVDILGADDLIIKGNFLGNKYTFKRASGVVATVSKKWAWLGDTYGVDIIPGEDDILILACTVVIRTIAPLLNA